MNSQNLYEQRQSFYLNPGAQARGGLIFCILIGVATFFIGQYLGLGTRTWGSFLFNLFWFFSIALGGVVFAAMQDVIGAVWGRPIMRIHEAFASFLPVAALLFAVFFLCIGLKVGKADEVYSWIKDPSIVAHLWGKRDWLQPGLMMGRDLFALVVILCTAGWQMRLKLRSDMALIRGDRAQSEKLGQDAKAKLRHWSAPVLVIYALTFSLLCFDLLMSLAPTWLSTLWAGWAFSIMMQSLMATLLISMYLLKRTQIGQLIRRDQFHDVGKIMHGFTIFFAYLTYAHILTYWYGNVPEETEYFIHRLQAPWVYLVLGAPIFSFVLPLFTLIPKMSKWTKPITMPIAFLILASQWFSFLVIVQPEVVDGKTWTFPGLEFGIFLGILGLFLMSVLRFAKRRPMVAVGDLLLHEVLNGSH